MDTLETTLKKTSERAKKQKFQQRKVNGKFRIQKYHNQKKKQQMVSTAEWRGQRKEPEILKMDKYKLPNLSNREKINGVGVGARTELEGPVGL